jgi:N-methylhydantoinase A/oxoprolinase/acetone carboxylase beta subunit
VLPGIGRLDGDAAARALARLGGPNASTGVGAADVIAVVDAGMEQALRTVSVARGVDPRGLALVAFGGAGPLHACALAEALELPVVIVPPRAGVFSAVGVLGAPHQADLVASWPTPGDHHGIADARRRLEAAAVARVLPGGSHDETDVVVTSALDCRYAGQSHELRVGEVTHFAAEHERRNGYAREDMPVEVIAIRASAMLRSPVSPADLPPPSRSVAVGPTVVAEADCTIWVPHGWRADPGHGGAYLLRPT